MDWRRWRRWGIRDPDGLTDWTEVIAGDRRTIHEKNQNRNTFMYRVHGMPNGAADKYNEFFKTLVDRVRGYQASNPRGTLRMMTTHDHFLNFVDLLQLSLGQIQNQDQLFRSLKNAMGASPTLYFDPTNNPNGPSDTMIEDSIRLGMWAWLQVVLQRKFPGGVRSTFLEGGQIVHPWDRNANVWDTIRNDLPYLQPSFLMKSHHEFSQRFSFAELNSDQHPRMTFRPTANLLDHLRVLKDYPEKYDMVVFVFCNIPMLYALIIRDYGTPHWYRDLAQETLNTLALLASYDVPGGAASFRNIFLIDLREPMEDQPVDQPVQNDQVAASVYLNRSLHNYPNWGARLLELEEVAKGQRPSTFNEWHQKKVRKRADNVALWAFILSAILLILTFIAVVPGFIAVREAKKANVYASIASTAADSGAAQTSSLLSCAVPYFCHDVGGNSTIPLTPTPTNSVFASATTTSVVTITATAFTTATVTEIVNITLTTT